MALIGAGILWINRATFCDIYHNLPFICSSTPWTITPPAACGRHCDPASGYDCPAGTACVTQYIYGGICLSVDCDMGCWQVCRQDAECAPGLTCQHDPAAPLALGYCVGSICPENRPCVNGDGACDPTCEQARLAANQSGVPVCGYRPTTPRLYTCTTYGEGDNIYPASKFISKDSDCEALTPTAATEAIPPGGGGGSTEEPTATVAPSETPASDIAECGPGWLPASGCVCCGTTLTCSDGTLAQFNPTCMGGGEPEGCTTNADCPPGQYCSLVTGKCEPFG